MPLVTVGRGYFTGTQLELHGIVMMRGTVGGGQVMIGGGMGRTIAKNLHWATPQALDAVQVTRMPILKGTKVPGGGVQMTVVPGGSTMGAG